MTDLKKYIVILACSVFALPTTCRAYSVLTHEAIIDAVWEKSIEPLLLKKFPGTTQQQLQEARGYAYGGAVAPDMGYFPFGSRLFTNLIHYVRSGDFVMAALQDAENVDDYAFALGMLSHYNADHFGHPIGVNISVPVVYKKDRQKFGDTVTYGDDPATHLKMEFSFDVLQTARGNYAPDTYHRFIGFEVSQDLLKKAFLQTYGLRLEDIFGNFSVAIGTFRWSVKNLFPDVTRVAWSLRKNEILQANPAATSRTFIFKIKKSEYNKQFGKERATPGFSASVLAFIMRIIPKVGPLKGLSFKPPIPQTEKNFTKSFDTTIVHYTGYMRQLLSGNIRLPNIDYDTGNNTSPGEYKLTDQNYGTLLLMLNDNDFKDVSSDLKENILWFYSKIDTSKENSPLLREIKQALNKLKATDTVHQEP